MTAALPDSAPLLQSCFLPTEHGEILVTAWLPAGRSARNWLLIAPPFAEEMNKSRRMLAMLGRRAAATGWGVLLVDLAGTGDSWGDFRDARYEFWITDLLHAVRWVEQQGGSVSVAAGLRFGGLLATDLAGRLATIKHLLLWQPAPSGADVLTQFLRLKTAAGLTGGGQSGDTLERIRSRLTGGEVVEIAGYELAPELYTALNRLDLARLMPERTMKVDWFHLVRQHHLPVPEAIARVAASLAVHGAMVRTHAVPGDAFWSTAEIAECEELLAVTVAQLAD